MSLKNKQLYLKSYVELEEFRTYIDDYFPFKNAHQQRECNDSKAYEMLISIMGIIALGKKNMHSLDAFYANDYFKRALNLHFYTRFNLSDALNEKYFLSHLNALNVKVKISGISTQMSEDALRNFSSFEDGIFNTQLKSVYLFIYAYIRHQHKVKNEKTDAFKKIKLSANQHQAFLDNGYLIIKDFLSAQQISEFKEITHGFAKEALAKDSAYLYGNGNKLQRVYNLLNKHQQFRDLITANTVIDILELIFERDTLHQKYYLSSFQSNTLNPGAEPQKLHVDSTVPDPLPPWLIRININFLLDDFTATNGSTLVAPGSHKLLRKPTEDENIALINVIAPAGSIVIWTGHLWHKSSANQSERSRTALLACFAASYLREVAVEENYLEVMDKEIIKDSSKVLQNLLGVGHGIKQGA